MTTWQNAPGELKLHVPPADLDGPCAFSVLAFLDPLSAEAQRFPPLLTFLRKELNAEIFLMLQPKPLVDAPLKSYYRVALAADPPAGGLAGLAELERVPPIKISLPRRRHLLMSTQLHVPTDWLVTPVEAGGADLDSLAGSASTTVRARFVLEAIFLEGWASSGGKAASGRQLSLVPLASSEAKSAAGSDSVVVRSGYFQLRSPPGLFSLSIMGGAQEEEVLHPNSLVELTDLAGRSALQVKLGSETAKKQRRTHGLKQLDSENDFEGRGGDPQKCRDTIHIFSVASGLRYERLLRIMLLSVREHTKCPLRLWLVENFLSASFRRILPGLAQRMGFAVSRVTYKWPDWLRAQSEKQRVIWAYKILFLDVLFPAKVKRVLFIDADQIVRADVKELWDTDLHGAVYGFVPFCSSIAKGMFGWGAGTDIRNPETVGFRFWEQGFWERHLGNQFRYHISALFVVDLVKFRSSASGDILRDTYQQLTADPGSLANLDQDLPNYIQGQIPIFSLPQEWLWCESWCNNASKAHAKTIDMCQNPLHKEGKLQQARRIAPEWTVYDEKLQKWISELNLDSP